MRVPATSPPAIRVAALTSGRNDPSSRFRIRQFLGPLRPLGIDAREYRPWISKYAPAAAQLTGLGVASRLYAAAAARRCDVAWLNRELVSGRASLERFVGRRRVLDVDDAIWLTGARDFARRIAATCDGVIAGNEAIAEHFQGHAPRIWLIPTVVDTDVWQAQQRADGGFVVGWSGTSWNLPYVYAIEASLARFLDGHPGAQFVVICDRRPSFARLRPDRWRYQRWSPEIEVAAVAAMDVGIMPLPDNEWTRAKCALKMLCCMATGRPVVASPVGAANDLIRDSGGALAARTADDWVDGLAALHRDRDRAALMGRAGRRFVREHYSVAAVKATLAQALREGAGS